MLGSLTKYVKQYAAGAAMTLMVIVSVFLYTHNLGHSYITLWDESVHVNIVKNLSKHCCTPILLPEYFNTDFRNWTDNNVWLHKPVLPFYISAIFYKFFGGTLFAMRFPGVIFAELIGLLLFFLGKKYFNFWVGLAAAGLFLSNSYTFELVQGRQFSGLSDLTFAFFCLLGLWFLLQYQSSRKLVSLLGLSGSLAVAYYCKGGLVVLPFLACTLETLFFYRTRQGVKNLFYAFVQFLILTIPGILYLAWRFPAEFSYEQAVQIAHVFSSVEYWGRPFDYYFTVYARDVFGILLLLPILLAVIYGFISWRGNKKIFTFNLWVVCFILPLSLMVSKISNFIYGALPVALILITAVYWDWWERKLYSKLAVISLSVLVLYCLVHFNIFDIRMRIFLENSFWHRSVIPLTVIISGLLGYVIYRVIPKRFFENKIKLLIFLSLVCVVFVSARVNFISSNNLPDTFNLQDSLRKTAKELNGKVPDNSIFFINIPELVHGNLFFMYWSSFPSLEVYNFHPISFLLKEIPKNFPVYIISTNQLKGYGREKIVPTGYLYKVRQ